MSRLFRSLLLLLACSLAAHADSITLTGTITQSQNDSGGNPAINNPSLNNVNDGDAYTVNFSFAGSILGPGNYALSAALFSDPSGPASENGFDSGTIVVTQSSGTDSFFVQACLTGFTCNQGNELDLIFTIAAASVNGSNVSANPISGLLPLDLLEDDGSTDIHASVDTYSYSASSVPEPASIALLAAGLATLRIRPRKK